MEDLGYIFMKIKLQDFFAFSNSFLLLEEFLIGRQNFSFNKIFSDNFVISGLCTPTIYETLVNEINIIPSNSYIVINLKERKYKLFDIDYNEYSIPLESYEGLKIIDHWIDKWGYILRSLHKQTNKINSDLSGGFDTRMTLAILLNSGIDMNNILINSINDTLHTHKEDFEIATNISSKFRFKLNKIYNSLYNI